MINSPFQPQTSLFALAPINYKEYLLVINPDAGVANDLSYTQKKLSDITGQPLKNNDTHITLASFYGNVAEEDKIASEIRAGIKGKLRASFIWLDNYGCHPASGSIYIKSKPPAYLTAIQQAILPCLALCSAIEKSRKINFVREPHVVVAKTNRKTFVELWQQYKDKKYENKFVADSLLLLAKNAVEDTCELVAEIKF